MKVYICFKKRASIPLGPYKWHYRCSNPLGRGKCCEMLAQQGIYQSSLFWFLKFFDWTINFGSDLKYAKLSPNPRWRNDVILPMTLYNLRLGWGNLRLGLLSWSSLGPHIHFLFLPCVKKLLDFWWFSWCKLFLCAHSIFSQHAVIPSP